MNRRGFFGILAAALAPVAVLNAVRRPKAVGVSAGETVTVALPQGHLSSQQVAAAVAAAFPDLPLSKEYVRAAFDIDVPIELAEDDALVGYRQEAGAFARRAADVLRGGFR